MCGFYSASALLAMQTDAVISKGNLSVCVLSLRLSSFTFRCFVQTNKDMIVRSTPADTTINLVSGEVKFIPILAGDHPQRW